MLEFVIEFVIEFEFGFQFFFAPENIFACGPLKNALAKIGFSRRTCAL